jgi:very-short-patch-repair endonuclease
MANPKPYRRTEAQIALGMALMELGFKASEVFYEYQFNPDRRWRADLAVPGDRLLLEADGGQFHGGHRRGNALAADYERQNWAVMNGWRLLRWTNKQILDGTAKAWLAPFVGR